MYMSIFTFCFGLGFHHVQYKGPKNRDEGTKLANKNLYLVKNFASVAIALL